MYQLDHFKTADFQEVLAFMKAHPFVVLCGIDDQGKPVATHIPVLIEEREGKTYLKAHVMRKQDHTLAYQTNSSVLAIFQGPQAYISASWYETQNVASTWNYQAVHASGNIRFLEEEELRILLEQLTAHFENNPHSLAQLANMDESYIAQHMKAIIAFEVELTEIKHVFKLSQNRDKRSFENIQKHLAGGGSNDQQVAVEMAKIKSQIFKG